MQYFHSVTLDREKCKGCTNCIKRCPTEAIRVRNGKAKIIKERCIDCGECIRVCPYHAKKAVTDAFDQVFAFEYKVALPAPTLYGQFKKASDINLILTGLKHIGFDDVFEVARAAEIVTKYTKQLLAEGKVKKPAISGACPAVLKLILTRFPNLVENILPILSPMEVAARLAKEEASKRTGIPMEKIGVFFISPCAAKVTDVKSPIGLKKSQVDGVISMKEVYMRLLPVLSRIEHIEPLAKAGMSGVGWANSGGESTALNRDETIAVDGIENVIKVLEAIEDERLLNVDFVELLSCHGGCVGGPLTVENNFVAKGRISRLAKKLQPQAQTGEQLPSISLQFEEELQGSVYSPLGNDMVEAMNRLDQIEGLYGTLPGIDCGSCGSPSCRALAEDVVQGFASENDCIFKLREKVRQLTKEMLDLDGTIAPVFYHDEGKE